MKDKNKLGSPEIFQKNWIKFDSLTDLYEDQFIEWIKPLTKDSFKNKDILDAGCGIGRNSIYALKYQARSIDLFDYAESTVEIAAKNLSNYKNAKVFVDSIYELKNVEKNYDLIMCIGVIHHLSEPKEAIEKLFTKLKKGGTLLIWVYGKEGNENLLKILLPIRLLTSRLPYKINAILGKIMTLILFTFLKFINFQSPYWQRAKKMKFWHLEQIMIDQLIPKIAKYYKKNELTYLYGDLNYSSCDIHHTNKNSWTVLINK